ncbi:Serine/threonine-protein kinase STY8 [Mycena sanguinolenta]|uniref:Serine/threonine-protein kinase STY8 n=1 Tax=Mycena sanguinolenta TaxID=230812 RepID=A0A8H6ZB15_9AGAR|nr:Serine/threonine-protein kinase STY8 [Mycena sanguinolenta]
MQPSCHQLCDVVEGLSYLHGHNIVHGDLCGRNILVDRTGRARLADFGLTELVESDMLMKSEGSIGRAGTTRFMAPELLFTTNDTQLMRAPASDIWAFGCVCCEVRQTSIYYLDRGFPDTEPLEDPKRFFRRAHRFLNWLATYFQLLPEEISVAGITLLGEYPVNHGGFSNIYRGIYKNADGVEVEVALKVLRMFQDQSDAELRRIHSKFSKEALVWHYLKHKNIVPFIGVDSTNFPSPRKAMVSPWMPLGSVLKYCTISTVTGGAELVRLNYAAIEVTPTEPTVEMVQYMESNSPSSPYAIELLCDVIEGLQYLHSKSIVHGDLCGRNILMDGAGHACLTDFGLAELIESASSVQAKSSSRRAGTARFMAPELLLIPDGAHLKRTPASDMWAFGCVCCEIWSEGVAPFSHILDEGFLIRTLSDSTQPVWPYPEQPRDKSSAPMPALLWELVLRCWRSDTLGRPSVQEISDALFDVKKVKHPNVWN